MCVITFLCGIKAYASDAQPPAGLRDLDYAEVGNLRCINAKYAPLMRHLGCLDNVLPERKPTPGQRLSSSLVLEEYQKECRAHLMTLRKNIVLKPLYDGGVTLGFVAVGTSTIIYFFGYNSMAGGLMCTNAVYQTLYELKQGVTVINRYLRPPSHPVDPLEIQYVENQCFIPRQLWPIIHEKFQLARQNLFEQREALNFLSFTLGCTLYKPFTPPLQEAQKNEPANVAPAIDYVIREIDVFFADYQPFDSPLDQYRITKQVKNFMLSLTGNREQIRPLFLHGAGGVGKTLFARKLTGWIRDSLQRTGLPNSVSFEIFNVTTPDELEGSKSEPGVFLRVFRNKCSQGTRGSIVFMDEASWINQPEFKAPTKRTYNGNLAVLSTIYFGAGTEGKNVELPMPPILNLLVNNDKIEDENTRRRFDHVNFPLPKPETLRTFSITLFKKEKKVSTVTQTEEQKIKELIQNCKTFGDIESIIPALAEQSSSRLRHDVTG
jgi:hypothetical protein